MGKKLLGELLIENGYINQEQLEYALDLKREKFQFQKIGKILLDLQYIDEDILLNSLGKQIGVSGVNLFKFNIEDDTLMLLDKKTAEKYNVIPIALKSVGSRKTLVIATGDPLNNELMDNLKFITGYEIEPVFALEEDIKWSIHYHYNQISNQLN